MKLSHISPLVAFAVLAVASPTFAAKAPAAPVSATALGVGAEKIAGTAEVYHLIGAK